MTRELISVPREDPQHSEGNEVLCSKQHSKKVRRIANPRVELTSSLTRNLRAPRSTAFFVDNRVSTLRT